MNVFFWCVCVQLSVFMFSGCFMGRRMGQEERHILDRDHIPFSSSECVWMEDKDRLVG